MSDLPRAWSASVRLATAPAFLLYDVRGSLLEELKTLAEPVKYRVVESGITIVYDGPRELHVGTDSTHYISYDNAPENDILARGLQLVSERLNLEVLSLKVAFQHLIPFRADPEEASIAASSSVFGEFADRTNMVDFAVLMDGYDESTEASYQAEFGVITAEEAPMRLARMITRVNFDSANVLDMLIEQDYPEAAVFVDSTWDVEHSVALSPESELRSLVQDLEESASKLAREASELIIKNLISRG